GRLAFTDHYTRVMARLRRELQQACHPGAIFQTVSQTGLALRDSTPRVYVVGGATGGAGGPVPHLGHAGGPLPPLLEQPDPPRGSLLFCGAPDDPATPRPEQANLYATLTELNHFADPSISFSSQYGTDGPRLVDVGPAFDHTYLIPQVHRSPEGRRDSLAHVGSYLFHELTTPLGLRLDQGRLQRGACPFRSLGTFGVWFPRGLLLRVAARGACRRVLEEWQSGGPDALTLAEQSVLDAAQARALADPELQPDALAARLGELATEHMDAHPREALTRLLLAVEEQSQQAGAQDDPGAWANQARLRVRDWLGSGVPLPGISAVQQRRSTLTRALETAAAVLAAQWDALFAETLLGLTEHAGRRIAVAEAAVARFLHFC